MGTRRLSMRWLLISLLSFVTIIATGLGQAASDPAVVVAAKNGDFETVRSLLAKGVNVNERARDDSTAVLWAVHQSDLPMVRALVAAGADLNTPNSYGVTPLLEASRTGDTPMIAELLKAGADVKKSVHPEGETPLMEVARAGKLDAVELLLKAGSDPERCRHLPEGDGVDAGGGRRARRCDQCAACRQGRSERQGAHFELTDTKKRGSRDGRIYRIDVCRAQRT